MMTEKREKTGIEFQSDSRRQKNHPEISRLLNQAARDGGASYRDALEACNEIKIAGSYTIEQAVEYINAIVSGKAAEYRAKRNADRLADREREQRIEEQKRQRRETNAFLRKHGYVWQKEGYASEEDADHIAGFASAPIGKYWTLYAPDNRVVSVEQALKEIEDAKINN